MTRQLLILSLLSFGCAEAKFTTVDEACHEKIPGEKQIDNDPNAIEAVWRVNCYRRISGIQRGAIDPFVLEGTHNHIDWVIINDNNFGFEVLGTDGYTGAHALERSQYAGLDWPNDTSNYRFGASWEGTDFMLENATPSARIDQWVDEFYYRQALMHPSWLYGAIGIRDGLASISIIWPPESEYQSHAPVIYPADGQVDVPPYYEHPYPVELNLDGLPKNTPIGYPITYTFGGALAQSQLNTEDPYELFLVSAKVTGPSGELDYYDLAARNTNANFPYSLAVIPRDPLEPFTTYTIDVEVEYLGTKKKISHSFTTGATDLVEPSTEKVFAPPMAPVIRHDFTGADDGSNFVSAMP